MMADNDFDEDFDSGEDFDDFDSGTSLGDAWRNNPLLKLGVVVVAVIVVIGGVFVFSGGAKEEGPEASKISSTPDINPDLGNPNVELPEQYKTVFTQANENEANRALVTGDSSVSPPIFEEGEFEDPLAALEQEIRAPQEDPLDIYRRQIIQQEVEEQKQQLEQQQELFVQERQQFEQGIQETFSIQPDPASVQQLSQAMLQQMNSILGGVTIGPVNSLSVTRTEAEVEAELAAAGLPTKPEEQIEDIIDQSTELEEVVIEAGELNYAQILNEATSDAPSPVVAVLLSGPLRGGRLIGDFQIAPTQQSLTLRFNILIKDGVTYRANSFAVDPNTSSPSIVTEYDRRIFRRVLLPAAAEFIEGLASAYAQQEQTTVVVGADTVTSSTQDIDFDQEFAAGVEEGADELSSFLQEEADQFPPLVRIAPGTPIGIIYIENVVEQVAGDVVSPNAALPALPPTVNPFTGPVQGLEALPVTGNPIADGLRTSQ